MVLELEREWSLRTGVVLLQDITGAVSPLPPLPMGPGTLALEHIPSNWLQKHCFNQSLCWPGSPTANPLCSSPLSFVLQKPPKDPGNAQFPSRTGTGNLVFFLSHRSTAVPAQRVESQARHFRRGENLGATDSCQQEDGMSTSH